MERLFGGKTRPLREMSALSLAFLGDGVYELLVREYLTAQGSSPVKKLHERAVAWVRCETQAALLHEALWPLLTEGERQAALRGRNAHVGHVPKNASVEDYHAATALEALFGWLYYQGELERLRALFDRIVERMEGHEGEE